MVPLKTLDQTEGLRMGRDLLEGWKGCPCTGWFWRSPEKLSSPCNKPVPQRPMFAGVFAFIHIIHGSDERDQEIGEIKCTTEP